VEKGKAAGVPSSRNCTLLRWVDGRFSRRLLTLQRVFAIGKAIAGLHSRESQKNLSRRRYWNADGLIGPQPKLGPVTDLLGATPRQQRTIDQARRLVHRRLSDCEKRFPERLGTIHADVHLGNVVFSGNSPRLIDFDDCGLGFYEYDLAVPLLSLQHRANNKLIPSYGAYRDALLSGYASIGKWDRQSDRILPYLMAARKIAMLGWLQSRSDHPGLRNYLRDAIPRTVLELQDLL